MKRAFSSKPATAIPELAALPARPFFLKESFISILILLDNLKSNLTYE